MDNKKSFLVTKIPHTGDTESVNQCGETQIPKKSYEKYKNHTRELKFLTGHNVQMLAKGCIAQSQLHKQFKKYFCQPRNPNRYQQKLLVNCTFRFSVV